MSVVAVGLSVTVLAAGISGCGDDKSSTASSTSGSPSPSSSSTSASHVAAQPRDYTNLLMKATDIDIPGDRFTRQQPELNPNGKPGVSAAYINEARTRRIDDTILVLPAASNPAAALDATKAASENAVSNATTQPVDVGSSGVSISGTSPDGTKAVTIVLFTEGPTLTTLEFGGAASDPVPPDAAVSIARTQDAAVRAGLPG